MKQPTLNKHALRVSAFVRFIFCNVSLQRALTQYALLAMSQASRKLNLTCSATPKQNELIQTLQPDEILQTYGLRTAETIRFTAHAKSRQLTREMYTPTLQTTPVVPGLPSYHNYDTMANLTVQKGAAVVAIARLLPDWTITVSQISQSTIPSIVSTPTTVLTIEYKITDPWCLNKQKISFESPNTYTFRVQYSSRNNQPPLEETLIFRHPKNEQLLECLQEDIYLQSTCHFTGYNRYKRIQKAKFKNAWGYMYVHHHAKKFPLFTYLNYQTPWEFKAFYTDIPEEIIANMEYPPTNIEIFDKNNVLQLLPIASITMRSKFDFWSVRQKNHPLSLNQTFDSGLTYNIRNFKPLARHTILPTAYLNGLLRAMLWDFHAWWTKVTPKLFSHGFFETSEIRKRMSEALTNIQHAQSRIIFYSPLQNRPTHHSKDLAQVHFLLHYFVFFHTKEAKFAITPQDYRISLCFSVSLLNLVFCFFIFNILFFSIVFSFHHKNT